MQADEWLPLGKVIGAHGIRGELRVFFFSGAAPDLAPGETVGLRRQGAAVEPFTLAGMAAHGRHVRIELEEVADRTAAESLTGAEIGIPRRSLPSLEDGSYYWTDLIGLEVRTTTGERLGRLDHILETGSNDVYVVRRSDREWLVPALATVVQRIDLESGQMWVDLPDGL